MKVLEIKNNLVKIEFTTSDNLILAGFVIIEDEHTPYVAQVLSLKADKGSNYAIVRLLFTFNDEGIVKNYDGSIPSLDAQITKLSSDELLDILPVNSPIEIGELAQQKEILKVDSSILEKNLLVCSENQENSNILMGNFILQLDNKSDKSIIFDIDGSYPGEKLIFGKDFKLPLNYETINYIYEHDLNDIDTVSKAIIQDIFLEVQEYSKTVLDKFIPFETFINVVDQQYRTTGVTELILLKNKLLKYKEMNVFAENAKDIQRLRALIRANTSNILDISTVNGRLQNEIITYVYNTINDLDLFVYSFVQLTNDNADKKLIRHMMTKDKIYSTIITNHNFKYLYELKERANNLILFAPQVLQHDFAAYNIFLNKLNPDEFVIYGKATQNIPLIVELAAIEAITDPNDVNIIGNNNEINNTAAEPEIEQNEQVDDFSEESNSYPYETLIEDTLPRKEEPQDEPTENSNSDYSKEEDKETKSETEIPDNKTEELIKLEVAPEQISNIIDAELQEKYEDLENPETNIQEIEQQIIEEEPIINDIIVEKQEPEIIENETVITSEIPNIEIPESNDLIEVSEETSENEDDLTINDNEKFSEIVDFSESQMEDIQTLETISEDTSDDLILDTDIQEVNTDNIPVLGYNEENLQSIPEPEIIEEDLPIDKVAKDVDELIFSQEKTEIPAIDTIEETESDLTEEDLNFIEDINNTEEEEKPPVVPVYPTENFGEAPTFEQGDKITHPKYGEGIVEKMIKYGNKTLCSINFINVGRRLLDPAISEMSKVN